MVYLLQRQSNPSYPRCSLLCMSVVDVEESIIGTAENFPAIVGEDK